MFYQVVYESDTKTFYSDVEASHHSSILEFFENVIGATVTEVREYVYEDNKKVKDLSDNFRKSVVINMSNEKGYINLKLPKIKKTISENELSNLIRKHIKIHGNKITRMTIKM